MIEEEFENNKHAILKKTIPWLKKNFNVTDEELSECYIKADSLFDKYNQDSSASFETYIYPYIKHLLNELRYGKGFNGQIHKILKCRDLFIKENGYEPTYRELAEEYELNYKQVIYTFEVYKRQSVPIDNLDFEDIEYKDLFISIPNGLLDNEEKYFLERYLKGDTEKELRKQFKDRKPLIWDGIVAKLKDYYNR